MKSILKEYIELTDEQKENIWNNCDFIFHTNVLLNLYRYSPKMSKLIIASMNDLKDRIWIPYNIAEEFLKNRHNIININDDYIACQVEEGLKEWVRLRENLSQYDITLLDEQGYNEVKVLNNKIKKLKAYLEMWGIWFKEN